MTAGGGGIAIEQTLGSGGGRDSERFMRMYGVGSKMTRGEGLCS